ncbi:SDR family oxidoreductase [Mycobacterium sp. GA-2829]|uniref:SDR family oxidoreductase n=1 Tax=Mycobacterium sp. GA-2829 TaxID=1772283 RepID=UPI00073FF2EB|nr:SDR family oxidoreductase [Mycobacterium sp. GA-2829]KUI36468.1 3-hydroxy-2-methylbutyryl-CoA dehydrogenase [Mycobacterium sp. GA-2829]
MDVNGKAALVTGAASGLGAATARKLAAQGARVVVVDLNEELGEKVAAEIGGEFVAADITQPDAIGTALDRAETLGELRALVHCAGKGGSVRVVGRDGAPGSLEDYTKIVNLNLVGTYNVLSQAAARMAALPETPNGRGVCVLTASAAAFEGQIGQIAYSSAKAGIVGMTLVAARDLARHGIRVVTIAPGVFDTPILSRFSDEQKAKMHAPAAYPQRLGRPEEFGDLAAYVVSNPMLNGEVIRLDGGLRMAAR